MDSTSKRNFNLKVVLCVLVGVLFTLSLLPLLYIAQYDLPTGDDLLFVEETSKVWSETNSLTKVCQVAAEKTRLTYQNWQGTYFSIFLMCLQPAIFSVHLYSITPFIILFLFITSTLFIGYVILIRCLKLDTTSWLLVTFTALLFQIQLLPDIREGFFWYNSAVLYTLSYCFLLFMFGFLLLSYSSRFFAAKFICTLVAEILAVMVAGGAFSLLIPSIVIVLLALFRDIKSRNKIRIFSTSCVLLILAVGAVISITAPGNAVRVIIEHSHYGSRGLNPLKAIISSILNGFIFIAKNTDFALVVFVGIWSALFFREIEKSSIRFFHPVIVFVISFGLVSMQFTPTLYNLSSIGPLRLVNVVYFSLYWFWAYNVFNLVGWMIKKRLMLGIAALYGLFRKAGVKTNCQARKIALCLVVILTFFAFAQREGGILKNPSIQSIIEIRSGSALEHYKQRLFSLQDGVITGEMTNSQILP